MDSWSTAPPWQQLAIHFAHTPELQTILAQPQPGPMFTAPTEAVFDQLVNQFWFKTAIALEKVVRGDRLIAAHLVLDLIRDCAVLGMMVRDRATGTNQHRHGRMGNTVLQLLPKAASPAAPTAAR